MIEPRRAPVRPRVFFRESGEPLPLEDEVNRLIEAGIVGTIEVIGGQGAGKTTALAHLAGVLPADAPVTLLDEPPLPELLKPASDLRICTTTTSFRIPTLASFHLAPWTDDDLIEYLLSLHQDRCVSVMARLVPEDRPLFAGVPDLWALILDTLATNESVGTARQALYHHLASLLPDTDLVERAHSACLNAMTVSGVRWLQVRAHLARLAEAEGVARVLRHEPVQMLLAADRVAADLDSEAACDFLAVRLPRELVSAAAAVLAAFPRACDHLEQLIAGPEWSHAMAASLLHATRQGWKPAAGQVPLLEGAYLDGALWAGIELSGARLSEADLSGADLRSAGLSGTLARKARFRQALLAGADLEAFDADRADFEDTDLSSARCDQVRFLDANLKGACLDQACLRWALLNGANLTGATFIGADLASAHLLGAQICEADFSGASLRRANLAGLRLREAVFRDADFAGARLTGCDLEGMDLPGINFAEANLTDALLTGSHMPGANLAGACLTGAGLADIDWEGADLSGADLTGASFHLGSSRSGLVCSPIACEGSRTGYYTDDYEEQHYKAPEEIRKANLCGADLRGAKLHETDFYLVDLRGAFFDPAHEDHLRRSGAILTDRV
jgi:uncharacterized protein YjbI with pentapeptide repeats